MTIVVSISVAYEGPNVEYFSTLEQAKQYLKNLSPSAYDWNLDHIEVYEVSRDFDVYELLKEDQ